MKLILTDNQARLVLQALEWAENDDYPDTDPHNACYIRIENKIRKALGEKERKSYSLANWEKAKKIGDSPDLTNSEKIELLKELEGSI